MSGPYDQAVMPTSEMMDPGYSMYDGHFANPYPRIAGPPTHFDGVAFWYRPNNTDPIYEGDPNGYGRGGALPGHGIEPTGIKHRRTRSGCFTCRSRRVKCDETRPICDRCKKGNRECEFPQPTSASKRAKHAESRSPQESKSKDSMSSSLDPIKDESEEEVTSPKAPRRPTLSSMRTQSTQSLSRKHKYRQGTGELSPTTKDLASPTSTASSGSHSRDETPASSLQTQTSSASAEIQARQAKIKAQKPDIQKYLQFQHDHLTYYHYFFKLDPTDFVHNEFIDLALTYEPLLYAAVGFAAYHYELRQENGKLSHFLGYHSKSLSMLRKSLEKGHKCTEATLLTVLQLAIFEEYLGDWVNLVGHHRAAHSMLLELFSVDTMMDTDLGRRIFSMYARLDVIAGLMSGKAVSLDRKWFEANSTWYRAQIDPDDVDIENTLGYLVAANRLLGMDMAALFAKLPRQEISVEDFKIENGKLEARLTEMKKMTEGLNDGYYTVQEFSTEKTRPLTDDDIVNPYIPGGLFKDALWPLNFMWGDWYAIEQMHKYQSNILLQQPLPPELEQLSLEQCRIVEAVDRWPEAPEGAVLGIHASMGLAAVFLKKDQKHIDWARKKLASIERLGYIYPPKFRQQMAQMWGLTEEKVGTDQSVEHWWLPDDEGLIPLLREIRNVVTERYEEDERRGSNNLQEFRDLKAIFAKLDLRSQSAAKDSGVGSSELNLSSPKSEGSTTGTSFSGFSSTSSADTVTGLGVDDGSSVRSASLHGDQSNPFLITPQARSKRSSPAASQEDRMSGVWDHISQP